MSSLSPVIKRAQQGDQSAFTELYEATAGYAYTVASRFLPNPQDIADAMQESYLSAFRAIGRFDASRDIRPWLGVIVRNQCINRLKKRGDVIVEDTTLDYIADDDERCLPEDSVEREETRRAVLEIIDSLPDAQRITVAMYYMQEMPVAQIAQALGVSEGTVKANLFRARANIKKVCAEHERRGVKLYGAAPLALLAPLFTLEAQAASVPAAVNAAVSQGLASALPQLATPPQGGTGTSTPDGSGQTLDGSGQALDGSGQVPDGSGQMPHNNATQPSHTANPTPEAGTGQATQGGADPSMHGGAAQPAQGGLPSLSQTPPAPSLPVYANPSASGAQASGAGGAHINPCPFCGAPLPEPLPNICPHCNGTLRKVEGDDFDIPRRNGGGGTRRRRRRNTGGGGDGGGGGQQPHQSNPVYPPRGDPSNGPSSMRFGHDFPRPDRKKNNPVPIVCGGVVLAAIIFIITTIIADGWGGIDLPTPPGGGSGTATVSSGQTGGEGDNPVTPNGKTPQAYNSFTTHKSNVAVTLEDGVLLPFNRGQYIYKLSGDNLTLHMSGSKNMPHGQTNFNPVHFDDQVYWLNGRVLMASPVGSPENFRELDLNAERMTYDDKSIYVVSDKDDKLYVVDPESLKITSEFDFPYKISTKDQYDLESGNSIRRGWAGMLAWDGKLYFNAQLSEGQNYYMYGLDLQSGALDRLTDLEEESTIASLCVDDSGFYFMDGDALYHLPHGTKTPTKLFEFTEDEFLGLLDFRFGNYDEERPDYLYLDGGYLYITYLPHSGAGIYRMTKEGQYLTAIPIPENRRNYVEAEEGVTIKDGWIVYNYGALHIGESGLDKEVYGTFPGYEFGKLDIPFVELAGAPTGPAKAEGYYKAKTGWEGDFAEFNVEAGMVRIRYMGYDYGLHFTVKDDIITLKRDEHAVYLKEQGDVVRIFEQAGGKLFEDGTIRLGEVLYYR